MIRVGCQYETTKCGPVTVIEQLSDYYYRVRFHKTGTEKAFRQDAIKRGEIKDPYAPLRCGVGITGDLYTKEKNAQIYGVWQHMIDRCYNPRNKRFQSYKHVQVCKEWLLFENFYHDYTLIDGFDQTAFENHELVLDKDKKQRYSKNKVYSLETCTWISCKENVHMQDIQMKPFIAIDPNGNKYHSDNITEFARQHEGLTRRHISGILHDRAKTTAGGWKFFYEEMT